MKKVRIVERTFPTGCIQYVIQQKWWLGWRDAWDNENSPVLFPTLEAAMKNRCWFDNTPVIDRVVG